MATCVYCLHDVNDETLVPPIEDDEAWQELAREHSPDCEWIETRAHWLVMRS